jgi:8-oxo-dGTP pyrophosphatase MutT (NUDIX family)
MAIQLFNVGVKAAIIKDEKILLVKHATKHFWDVPGGRIDDNESIQQTLERELLEELPGSRLIGIAEVVCAFRVPDIILENDGGLFLVVYKADVEFDNQRIVLSGEHSEAKWASYDEGLEIGSHIVKETIKALRN